MLIGFKRGQGSIVLRVKLLDSSVTTGAGKTGLTFSSTGLIIGTIADNEATTTAYTTAGSTIETVTTLGTYAAPTATKCRFKEVDATNHKGLYEIQIADARFAVSNSKFLQVSISGVTGLAECDFLVPLTQFDPYDGVRGALTALPNAAAQGAGGLFTIGTGAGQVNQDANGRLDVNNVAYKGTALPAANTAGVPVVDTREILRQGTAQAGASGSITLDSGASATDNLYLPCRVRIIAGTGANQGARVATGYVGSTKVLSVVPAWVTNPSTDSVFQLEAAGADVETWLRAAPSALVSGAVPASADLVTWKGTAPNNLTSGRVDSTVGAAQAGVITAASIATDAVDADALATDAITEIVAAVWVKVVEANGTRTAQQAMSLILAFAAGITANGGSTIKDPEGTANRIVATIDGSNNRTGMILTPSA